MEFNRCTRCGNFYVAEGNVCPKCSQKDGFEFSKFKAYIKENGLENSLDTIADKTGISVKNINRFLGYDEFKNYQNELSQKNINTNINLNEKTQEIDGITYFI